MAVGIGVVVATFVFVLPQIADYRDVWGAVKELDWQQLLALAAATLVNLATYAPPWQAALPGLHFRQAFVVTQASTASTYIAPGGAAVGMALSYGMLRGWGFPGASVGLAVAVTGLWNQLVLLGFPVLALALLTSENETHPLLETVSLIGVIVLVAVGILFALGLSTARIARAAGNLSARVVSKVLALIRRREVGWGGESFVRFRAQTVGLLRRRWHVLTLATFAGHLSVFLLFVVCLRTLGVSDGDVTIVEAFAAWSLVRLLGSIPLTPGGIGIVEVGLTTALIGFGGANAEVVAAVLVYRFLTLVPTLVLGLVLGATWRRHQPADSNRRSGRSRPCSSSIRRTPGSSAVARKCRRRLGRSHAGGSRRRPQRVSMKRYRSATVRVSPTSHRRPSSSPSSQSKCSPSSSASRATMPGTPAGSAV